MNKKIKHFFVACPKNLELLVEHELHALGIAPDKIKQTLAGVHFKGTLLQAYKVCLWSRCASRVLLVLDQFFINSADDLYNKVLKIDWLQHLTSNTTFVVDFNGVSDVIKNTQYGALKIKDAIVDQIRFHTKERPSIDKQSPMLRVNGHLHRNQITISIDLSGESLHRRGYRVEAGIAPIKENLAAAILYRSGWEEELKHKNPVLIDPMCGSGTLLIEAGLMAFDIAPGLLRKKFGFEKWLGHDEKLWQKLLTEAEARRQQGLKKSCTLIGYDWSLNVIEVARENTYLAGLKKHISIKKQELSKLLNPCDDNQTGLIVTNPPYGERLSEAPKLTSLYRSLGNKFKEHFLHWKAAVLAGNPDLGKNMGIRISKKYNLYNGTIPCQLLLFTIEPEWFMREKEE